MASWLPWAADADLTARLARVEAKLDAIIKHFGIEFASRDPAEAASLSTEARGLADRGKKILAIKVHRQETGAGLREAKLAVDAYLRSRSFDDR